jgi:histidyl-tRNA synthetase
MRDLVPPVPALRRAVAERILAVYDRYGYETIETPSVESLSVLLSGQGGDNEKLVFKILQRGESLERALAGEGELAEIGLRFDLTVPLSRFVASHQAELPMPFKSAQLGPVWRAERPQKGRYRQFTQCDIDIMGEPSVAAEIELCLATLEALDAIGLRGCTIRLNDRRVLSGLIAHHLGPDAPPGPVYIALDKLDKLSPAAVAAELESYDPAAVRDLIDLVVHLGGLEGDAQLALLQPMVTEAAVLTDLERTLGALPPGRAVLDPGLVRGMGYYTGQVFEVSHPDVGYSVAGGGRYDGMTARFGGPDLPACGFSIGFERVCDLVEPGSVLPARAKVAVLWESDEDFARAQAWAGPRRAAGDSVSVIRRARNVRKQWDDLLRLGFTERVEGSTLA